MKRLSALAGHAMGSLARRGGRSTALVLALALTTGAFSAVYLLGESVRLLADRLADAAPVLTVQRLTGGRPALLDGTTATWLRAEPSVRGVEERVWGYLYQPALESNVVVLGLSSDALAALGEDGALASLGATEVVVGAVLARSLGLRRGDRLALVASEAPEGEALQVLTVRGVLPEATASSHGDTVITSPALARTLLGLPDGAVVDLAVDVFPPEEAPVIARHIVEHVPGARVIERDALLRRRTLTFEARSGLLAAALLPLLLSLLVLAWDRLSGLGEEERREIGILKAVGFSTGDVLTCRLIESGVIAFSGGALGVVLGYVHVFVLGAPGLFDAYFGWSNVRPELLLVPTLDLETVVFLLAAVIAPFVAVSIVPAWRAAIVDPDRAMRGGA